MALRISRAPASRARVLRRRAPRRAWAAALACALGLVAALPTAQARVGELGRQVFAIEGRHGADPGRVIEELGPLQAPARQQGGDDLRVFLAAWGYAHAATNQPAVAEAAIEELTVLGERRHDDAATASAWTLRAEMLSFSGRQRQAFGWADGAVPLARRNGDPELRYWVDMTAADLGVGVGQIDEAASLFVEAVAAARETGNARREGQAWLALGPLHLVMGRTAQALEDAERTRELGHASGAIGLVVAGWTLESLAAEQAGDPARHARARAAALEAARALPPPTLPVNAAAGGTDWLASEVDAQLQLAAAFLTRRDWIHAQRHAQRALDEARRQGRQSDADEATLDLGLAEIGLGHLAAGRRLADPAMDAIAARGEAESMVQLHRYVDALDRGGDATASLERLRQAMQLEARLSRRDHESTVVALQRENSEQQHEREMDQLQHDNAMQRAELARQSAQRVFVLALLAVLSLGVVVAGVLYRRARAANRQLAANNAELEYVSLHDKVTGLRNRRAMEADAAALGAAPYWGVTIAVKQFGLIVGSLGHQQGDHLLQLIASRLDAVTRRRDGRLYRLDGVTFGAILQPPGDGPMAASEAALRETLAALMAVMEPPFELGNQDVVVSIAAGAVRCPDHAQTPQELARLAELARLRAHHETGNASVVYDAAIGESQRDKLRLEAHLLKALDHGDFEVHYQAQRDLRAGRIAGFEALLRWHDEGRMVSPAQFIPLAEETGLIVRIGAWVLRQACLQAKAWADGGHGRPVVAVNISPRQFRHPDFLAQVAATLRETGVDPAQIELEITEGSVMDDAEASIAQLHALRAMGMQLAIDDFGTGYASLAYLRRFPLDRLKIDRSFIIQLNQGKAGDTIVRTMIELAHSLGLEVTAEGVETIEQEEALRGWACDTVQGFLHARPVAVSAATEMLLAEGRGRDAVGAGGEAGSASRVPALPVAAGRAGV